MNEYYLNTNNIIEWAKTLEAGDRVYLSGTVFTARDAVHKKLVKFIKDGSDLPLEIKNSVVYYAGPTPAKGKLAIGSIGPTTSSRMDVFSPVLLDLGQKAMIGKGNRSEDVVNSMVRNGAVYFAAVGGAGALYSQCIKDVQVVAFPELGCESLKKLAIENMPLLVAIDSKGNSLYK